MILFHVSCFWQHSIRRVDRFFVIRSFPRIIATTAIFSCFISFFFWKKNLFFCASDSAAARGKQRGHAPGGGPRPRTGCEPRGSIFNPFFCFFPWSRALSAQHGNYQKNQHPARDGLLITNQSADLLRPVVHSPHVVVFATPKLCFAVVLSVAVAPTIASLEEILTNVRPYRWLRFEMFGLTVPFKSP